MAMIRPGSYAIFITRYPNSVTSITVPCKSTKNGAGDLVVLNNAEYERLTAREELYRLLDEGLESYRPGGRQTD